MNHYRTITFQPPASELTNFPLLVRIQNHPMTTRIASQYGYDVCFEDSEGNPLAFDLDYYDPDAQSGAWWVKIPSLPASDPTTIKMRYGDSTIDTNRSSPLSVWSDYGAVYHFNELSGTSQTNRADGVQSTAALGSSTSFQPSTTGTGRLLRGAYSGSANDVTQGITTQMTLTSPSFSITMIAYNRATQRATSGWLSLWAFNAYSSGSIYSLGCGLLVFGSTAENWNLGAYPHSCTATTTSSTPGVTLYGASYSEGNGRCVQIGNSFTTGHGYAGTSVTGFTEFKSLISSWDANWQFDVDELRFCKIARSQDWMAYENANYMNHSANVTYGDEMNSDGTKTIKLFPGINMKGYWKWS